jgi:signal transduction histidine kinase
MDPAPDRHRHLPKPIGRLAAAIGRARRRLAQLEDAINGIPTRVRRLPIRWRLAGASALLTLVILCAFAWVVGRETTGRIRSDFEHKTAAAADDLRDRLDVEIDATGRVVGVVPNLDVYAAPEHAVIRVLALEGTVIAQTRGAPQLGFTYQSSSRVGGYLVETRAHNLTIGGSVLLQYARPVSDMEATIARVRLFLVLGVLGGTALALLAGVMIARRAMAPIAQLTSAAREIERTGDPRAAIPQPGAHDEVAELARTLDGMLRSLAEARAETESMLVRQRQFVADASHELRTPLTSVLANLELLAESLRGDQGEAARSALRSSQRMRRLVGDLLLLARADIARVGRREPLDLAQVAIEAAAELEPVANHHELSVDAQPAYVLGTHDELHRLAVNLIENAIHHTPPGTHVRISTRPDMSTRTDGDGQASLIVEDDGPGISDELAPRLFERFVRGAGDRGGSFGIGLAIVAAVAESHGGTVLLERPEGGSGARFVVRLPELAETGDAGDAGAAQAGSAGYPAAVTSASVNPS